MKFDKPVKSYTEFKKEKMMNESRRSSDYYRNDHIDEGRFRDAITGVLKKIGEFFTGIGSTFLNALISQKKRQTPSSVILCPSDNDVAVLRKEGVSIPKIDIRNILLKREEEREEKRKRKRARNVKRPSSIKEAIISQRFPRGEGAPIDIGAPKFKELVEKQIYNAQKGTPEKPLLIWGVPGIGKTAIINQIADEYEIFKHNGRLIVADLQVSTPEDFTLPVADREKKTVEKFVISWLPVYDASKYTPEEGNKIANGPNGKGGIIFFDEIARCTPAVQSVLMKLCDADRRIENWVLGDKWAIVAAANREMDAGIDDETFHFNPTLGNRFKQYNYVLDVDDWVDYAIKKDSSGKSRVEEDIVTFLQFKPDYFHRFDPDALSPEDTSKPVIYPSPRKWEDASDDIRSLEEFSRFKKGKINLDYFDVVAGNVGKAAAQIYMAYIELKRKINPADIRNVYTNPSKAPRLEGLNLDEQRVLIQSVIIGDFDVNDTRVLDNITDWIIGGISNAATGILAFSMLRRYKPELEEIKHWTHVCKNKFIDAFPELMNEK